MEAIEVQRDEFGFWTHPDYFEPAHGYEFGVFGEFVKWLESNNLESFMLSPECDPNQQEFAEKYADGEYDTDLSLWDPTKPDGDGWFVGAIHNTENGPYCIWLRNK